MTPFDDDVRDVPREQLSPRERLLRLLPRLTDEQCAALVHQGEEMDRARREYHARVAAEKRTGERRPDHAALRAARLVGPERAEFLGEQ